MSTKNDLPIDASQEINDELPVMKEAKEDMTVTVLASTDLADFAKEDPSEWNNPVEMRFDAENGVWRPADSFTDPEYEYPSSMFFKWTLVLNGLDH